MTFSRKAMETLSFLTLVAFVLPTSLRVCLAIDSISFSQSITDGKTIASKYETFELGFFSPGNSKKRYGGIWYKNIPVQTVVWIANRSSPINDSSGILTINSTGNLVLTHKNTIIWYIVSKKKVQNPVAQLLDSGNLVIRDESEESPESHLWQSFDYPSDTMLPGMKFGWDIRTGLNRNITSWKSPDDPAPGDFSLSVKLNNYPEAYIIKGDKMYYRTGPWNGLHLSGRTSIGALLKKKFISNEDEVYITCYLIDKSVIARAILNQTTSLFQLYVWMEDDRIWKAHMAVPMDYCDNYGLCGVYGTCIITESPVCKCMKGFKPKSLQAWNSLDWSKGCVRNKPLSCVNNSNDGFMKFEGLKVPDTTNTWVDKTINLEECKIKCLNNCSCMAFANSNISGGGSGCVMWFGDLIAVREFSVGGQNLYIRMAASELVNHEDSRFGHKKLIITVATIISAISWMLGSYYVYIIRRNMTVDVMVNNFLYIIMSSNTILILEKIAAVQNNDDEDTDLPLFNFSSIATATDNFSIMNKIGEGGFGPVYKGRLVLGQEIAVKRLSKSSRQGMTEFKNEVKLIAKLQHRNLVKLLGCCIQGQEKILVYEYMPNASLDCFIFDNNKGKLIDWPKRFNIIYGITCGLLYLHQDSRLRIIHRDLKASNILLDNKLNPKISDFGMARILGGDQIDGKSNTIVGTFDYIAPEYAADGLFSIKSDLFSFGILLLEIICGKRNRGFYHQDALNLISHAWMLWKDDQALELVDTNLTASCTISEVLRCIHISLLCVQQFPHDRPTMSSVIRMLEGEDKLFEPKLPGYFPRKDSAEAKSSSTQKESGSINAMSITLPEAR